MRARVRLEGPDGRGAQPAVERILSRTMRVELAAARTLLSPLPTILPRAMEAPEAEALATELSACGLQTSVAAIPEGRDVPCVVHPHLLEGARCSLCSASLCVICDRRGQGVCPTCLQAQASQTRHQRIRVSVLLTILFAVCLLAAREWRRRHLGWEQPQRVAILLLEPRGTSLSPDLAAAFFARVEAVEEVLWQQRRRFDPSAPPPVEFSVVGPLVEQGSPPDLDNTSWLELLRFNLALDSYADAQDEAADYDASAADVRIYVRVLESGGTHEAAEGLGQQRGRIGVVTTEISLEGIDFAWFVALHEYFHTRGATDKYDRDGWALVPQGLAAPDQRPVLPQPGTEVMARGRPVIPRLEDLPGAPETWVVGRWTAAEIGWTAPLAEAP